MISLGGDKKHFHTGKTIDHMGNVTCAAAAAGAGILKTAKDFYLLYSLYSSEGGGQE